MVYIVLFSYFITIVSFCVSASIVDPENISSPLRVAQCRATCLEKFSNDGPNGESMCLQGPDCFMCWENCELLQSNFQVWGEMCEEKEICFPGCQQACHFHKETSRNVQQTQPVIRTKGETVIQVDGALARWPRPTIVAPTTPLVYVVMRRSPQSGPWRQIIQTIDLTTRVPINSNKANATLKILVVSANGLVTIYSPDEENSNSLSKMIDLQLTKKRKKTVNTEIKSTNRILNSKDKWVLEEKSLIHQKILVIGELSWEPRTLQDGGQYLVTWELDGGGLKGNLFTDSTCVTLSLWPDTLYHIQVELVSRTPGIDNLKSEMLDLDTSRAQIVSTESQEISMTVLPSNEIFDFDNNDMANSLSSAASSILEEFSRDPNKEIVTAAASALLLFVVVLIFIIWRYHRITKNSIDNFTLGSSFSREKLIDDKQNFHPIVTVVSNFNESCRTSKASTSSRSRDPIQV